MRHFDSCGVRICPQGLSRESVSTVIALPTPRRVRSVLQSRVHEVWARFMASSMKDDLRYTPSDCFETFPFPSRL